MKPGPEFVFFFKLNSTEHETSTAHEKNKINTNKEVPYLISLSDVVFIILITSIATAAKQPSSKPQGFDERSSYLGIAYF